MMKKRTNSEKTNAILSVIVKALIVIIVFVILYLPLLVIGIQSVNDSKTLYYFGGLTFRWYRALFDQNSPDYARTLVPIISNTLVVTFIATAISTVAGTFIAIGINSLKVKDRQKVIILNNIPILNADVVTGISLMLIFSALLPIFPDLFGFKTVLLAHIFFTLPYVILSVLPKLREIDPNLYDAAVDLGCTPFKALLKVVIPSIKAGIFAGMLLAFTMSIDDFVISFFTSGNFNNISIWIYSTVNRRSLSPAVYAYNTLITLATLFILLIINISSYVKANRLKKFNVRRV